jgi:hypothetical protein
VRLCIPRRDGHEAVLVDEHDGADVAGQAWRTFVYFSAISAAWS